MARKHHGRATHGSMVLDDPDERGMLNGDRRDAGDRSRDAFRHLGAP